MEQSIFISQMALPQNLSTIALPVMLIVFMYLLVIRPTKQRQKKLESTIAALKNGDRVVTSSGIYGVVAGIKDKTFIIKIADQVKIEVSKNAIAGLQEPEETPQ
jgi:preprotein translocase subunit YajC